MGLADSPGEILASMGNYVANADALVAAVTADAENVNSRHDMGGDIAPYFVERGTAGVYDFLRNDVPGSTPRDRDYWRDVGTIDAFYEANIDLISIEPVFNLYNDEWPLYSGYTSLAPAKFVHAGAGRLGHAVDSVVSPGVLVSGATVSGLGPLAGRPAALVGAGHGLGAHGRRARRAGTRRCTGRSSTRTSSSRSASASGSTTTTTARAGSPSPSPASPSCPKGTVITD